MTPGETGGCEEILVSRAPKVAILYFLFRRLRGSPIHKAMQAPGFTRGHNRIAPTELLFAKKKVCQINFSYADPRRKTTLI